VSTRRRNRKEGRTNDYHTRISYGGGDELPTSLDPQVDPAPGEPRPDRPASLQPTDLSIYIGEPRVSDGTTPPTARPMRVVVGHATPVIRCGICAILAAAADIEVVGEAASGSALQHLVPKEAPDVLVIDTEMKGISSGAMLRQLCTGNPALPVLVVAGRAAEEAICAAVRAGVVGCLLVDEPPERIVAAVRGVARGERSWFSQPVAEVLARCVGGRENGIEKKPADLTPREAEILHVLAIGKRNADMARELGISVNTIQFHLRNIYGKLTVNTRGEAIAWAARHGFLTE